MMYLENQSLFKWLAIAIFMLPTLAVFDVETALYVAPACFLGIVLVANVPVQMLVVSPEHLHDALEEYVQHEDVAKISVYHKSIDEYAKIISQSEEFDSTDLE